MIGLHDAEPIRSKSQQVYQKFYDSIVRSKDELIAIGYDEFTFEAFYDVRVYLFLSF